MWLSWFYRCEYCRKYLKPSAIRVNAVEINADRCWWGCLSQQTNESADCLTAWPVDCLLTPIKVDAAFVMGKMMWLPWLRQHWFVSCMWAGLFFSPTKLFINRAKICTLKKKRNERTSNLKWVTRDECNGSSREENSASFTSYIYEWYHLIEISVSVYLI